MRRGNTHKIDGLLSGQRRMRKVSIGFHLVTIKSRMSFTFGWIKGNYHNNNNIRYISWGENEGGPFPVDRHKQQTIIIIIFWSSLKLLLELIHRSPVLIALLQLGWADSGTKRDQRI